MCALGGTRNIETGSEEYSITHVFQKAIYGGSIGMYSSCYINGIFYHDFVPVVPNVVRI